MDERETGQDKSKNHVRKAVRPHPKPPMAGVSSLNEAIRQELWYIDTMLATPFRTARRPLETRRGSISQGADEALWALEGMARLPIKVLQSAFGENLNGKKPQPDQDPHQPDQE
jgi:hypothetical protein